jgi:predicted nucleic acid-binding protein
MIHVLSDTNILLRNAAPDHPMHNISQRAVEFLRQRGDNPSLIPQNLVEFRTVATRPLSVNGLGMDQVKAEIAKIKQFFPIFEDVPAIFAEWERLVETYGASGKQNHDARIVAAMNVHNITTILTFNKEDFVRYTWLTVLEPKDLVP